MDHLTLSAPRKKKPRARRAGGLFHTVVEVDEAARIGWCLGCGAPVQAAWNASAAAKNAYAWFCAVKRNQAQSSVYGSGKRDHARPYLAHRGDTCEYPGCGFTPDIVAGEPVAGQLVVHHRDGDKKNNDPANLTTLCDRHHKLIHAEQEHRAKQAKSDAAAAAWLALHPELNGGPPPEALDVILHATKREYDAAYSARRRAISRAA